MREVHRRAFLGAAGGALFAGALPRLEAQPLNVPIIDCHIHLFDQTRPQGAPYSAAPGNTEPALPARYRSLASPLGIMGAIVVEASPWIEDNLWVLQVAETDRVIAGVIGNLQPDKPEFKEYLERHHRNPLFLGIRYGNLWGYNLVSQVSNAPFIEGLKLLQQADLTLDTANPRPDLLEAVLRVNDRVPGLRIVVDHLPAMMGRLEARARPAAEKTLRDLAQRPMVFIKVSEVLRLADGKPATGPALYKPLLDSLFDIFGENKLLFGSDWPNSIAVNNLPAIVQIVRDYFEGKGRAACEKYFWRNSLAAYKWKRRDPSQPQA